MKRFISILCAAALLSCLCCASAADSRTAYQASLEQSGIQLPPAADPRYRLRPAVCGGVPSSSLPETEAARLSWLDDACILGHSHAVGMGLTLDLGGADLYAAVSLSAPGFLDYREFTLPNGRQGDYAQALAQKDYGKIYIMLGTNDMPAGRRGLSAYREAMTQLIESVRLLQPGARVYLLSLAPVGEKFLSIAPPDSQEKVVLYTQALKSLSRDLGLPYIDICGPLCGADGLAEPSLTARDGLHFNAAGYARVLDCVLTHTG